MKDATHFGQVVAIGNMEAQNSQLLSVCIGDHVYFDDSYAIRIDELEGQVFLTVPMDTVQV